MREQFNFSMSDEEAAPIISEAKRRGMLDKDGEVNRAMIARTLVSERISQLSPNPGQKLDAILQEAIAAGVNPGAELKRAIRRSLQKPIQKQRKQT